MTPKELNRDIKHFAKNIKSGKLDQYSEAAKKEFSRISEADREMEDINKESVLILFILNRIYNYVPCTMFGPSDIKL